MVRGTTTPMAEDAPGWFIPISSTIPAIKFAATIRTSVLEEITMEKHYESDQFVPNPYEIAEGVTYPECVCITCDPDQQYLILWCDLCGESWDRREGHECEIEKVHSFRGHYGLDEHIECLGCWENHQDWLSDSNPDGDDHDCELCVHWLGEKI